MYIQLLENKAINVIDISQGGKYALAFAVNRTPGSLCNHIHVQPLDRRRERQRNLSLHLMTQIKSHWCVVSMWYRLSKHTRMKCR